MLIKEMQGLPVADASSATRSTVGTVDGLLVLGKGSILGGTKGWDTVQGHLAVTTLDLSGLLGSLDVGKLAT